MEFSISQIIQTATFAGTVISMFVKNRLDLQSLRINLSQKDTEIKDLRNEFKQVNAMQISFLQDLVLLKDQISRSEKNTTQILSDLKELKNQLNEVNQRLAGCQSKC